MLPNPRFTLGRLLITPAARSRLEEVGISPSRLVERHLCGDWGCVDDDDWRSNNAGLASGERLFSAYDVDDPRGPIWIITERDRSATTILLPDEYQQATE